MGPAPDRIVSRLAPAFWAKPFAHRGLHAAARGVVENSRAAVAEAVAAGYGIEIDLQLSADGEAMVFHDDELDRLTALSGPVSGYSAAELGRTALAGSDETIPTLADILTLVDGAVALLVEVKDQSGDFGPTVGALEARTAEVLSGYAGPAAVMSFNPHSMIWFRERAPARPRGIVACAEAGPAISAARRAALAELTQVEEAGADFVSYRWTELERPAVTALRARGMPLFSWTLRAPGAGGPGARAIGPDHIRELPTLMGFLSAPGRLSGG